MVQFQDIPFEGYLKNLTENKLRSLVLPEYYKRGNDYYRIGMVVNPKFHPPNKLTAFVRGHLKSKYIITIEGGEKNLDCTCTCPTGYEFCKHIVATLLLWINEPEKFKVINADNSGVIEEETGSPFIGDEKIRQILMTWEKEALINKIISILKESAHIRDVNYLVEFLNKDINCKTEILEKFTQFKKRIPQIFVSLKSAYNDLQQFYENYDTPDEWYSEQDEVLSEEEKDLQEPIDEYIKELNEIGKFIQVLFNYELNNEARVLYDLMEDSLGSILDPKNSDLMELGLDAGAQRILNESETKENPLKNFTKKEGEKDEEEGYFHESGSKDTKLVKNDNEEDDYKEDDYEEDDYEGDDYEDEELIDYDYINLSELKELREQLRSNYLLRSYDNDDHSTKLTKYLELYQKQPSETVKRAILGLYTLDDLSTLKECTLKSKQISAEFFELIISLLKKDNKTDGIIDICQQFLTAPYKEQVFTHLVNELSKQDPEQAIHYCHAALQEHLNLDFFTNTLFDILMQLGRKEEGLNVLTEYYLQKGSNALYVKLKSLAEDLQQWENVASCIIEKLTTLNQANRLLNFYGLEKRFTDAIALVTTKPIEAHQIIRIADECQSQHLYPEAVKLFKATIRQFFYPGKGLIDRLNEAAKVAIKMKECYLKMEDLASYNAYIKKITTNHKNLNRFKTEFLLKI